jgi:hypothetical protein
MWRRSCLQVTIVVVREGQMDKRSSVIEGFRYRGRVTKLRLPLVWLRNLRAHDNDVFIASYPRAGNTWARFLLSQILTQSDAGFATAEFAIPYLTLRKRIPSVLPGGGRMLKTHEPYSRAYKRAIYFVRDPRDMVVSNYDFERGSLYFDDKNLDEFVTLFVKGKINAFGSWRSHVTGWLNSPPATCGNLLVVKYEDMRTNTELELTRMVKFLGLPVTPETIRKAIADNSLERMRKKEDMYFGRNPGDHTYHAGRRAHVGSVGGWQLRLTAAQIEHIEGHAAELMERLGYSERRQSNAIEPERPVVMNDRLLDPEGVA